MCAILSLAVLNAPALANECIDNFSNHVMSYELEFVNCQLNDNDLKPIIAYANSHTEIDYINLGTNNISDEGLKTLALLQIPLDYLGLDHNHISGTNIASLNTISVSSLNLSANPVGTIAIKTVIENPTLQALQINNTNIDDGIVDIFKSKRLNTIDIASDNLSSAAWEKIGETLQQENIFVSGKNLDDGFAKAFAKNPSPSYLALANSNISPTGYSYLMQSTSMTSLFLNDIHCNSGVFEAIGNAPHSSLLNLYILPTKLKMNGKIAKQIAKNTSLTLLAILNFRNEDSIDLNFAKEISQSNSLTTLDIYDREMDDAKAIAIANSKNIESLTLSMGNISDDGAIAIAAMPKLNTVSLSENHISDKGALAFLDKTNLILLDLSYNQISEQAVNKLKANLNIENLFLYGQFQKVGKKIMKHRFLNKHLVSSK